jgi:general nucleoside transport system ATP-binding protein
VNLEKRNMSEYIVEMKGIVKRFPGITASDGVDFKAKPGEINGLLGENGAGKSTLMKILYGIYQLDEGEIYLDGRKIERLNPAKALKMGIGFVRQTIKLIPDFTVAENILLGYQSPLSLLNLKKRRQDVAALSERYGLKIDPDTKIKDMELAGQQKVEILKALFRKVRILILDEPTSSLSDMETEKMFQMIRKISEAGVTIIFITHKIEKALDLCDKITVLRRGKVVGDFPLSERRVSREELVDLMVGESIALRTCKETKEVDREKHPRLRVENLSAGSADWSMPLKCISFDLFDGEILGVAGVSGNGQKELAETLFGLRAKTTGSLSLSGQGLTRQSPREMIERGVFYIPSDRDGEGLLQDLSILFNANVEVHSCEPMASPGCLKMLGIKRPLFQNSGKMKDYAEEIILQNRVQPANPLAIVKHLSGGNAQKVLLGKVLARSPNVVIVHNPTRGLDVKSRAFVHERLLELRKQGKAIILISDELDEIEELSDRIAVMYEGEVVDILSCDASRSLIGKRIAGIRG